ncbi:MAG: hypothetical protein NTX54_00810, partial [Chloroflexi bacterium]|nr:hypothetical protein [Chloroflexota bacterium]
MKASLTSVTLAVTFALLGNALLLSGLIRYGNDTAHWDIPYRALASALASHGDVPLWYPGVGNGFPHLNFQWVSWVANPVGILVSLIRPYDYLSLALENTFWRAVGFGGAFLFARQWVTHPVGAVAVAATYVGSGTMSWAALSYSALIGQMFAPWVLASGSLAIRASSLPQLARATGVFGLVCGLMVWCAYPGAWLTAPVLSGPVLLGLALAHRRGHTRLGVSVVIGGALSLLIVSLIASESTSLTLIEGSIVYSRRSEAIREGFLRGIDLAGLFLANPSYVPGVASPLMHPLYSGVLPPLLLLGTLGLRKWFTTPAAATGTTIIALGLGNLQNWTLWDHPILRELPALKDVASASDHLAFALLFIVPLTLTSASWGRHLALEATDKVLLAGAAWVLIVSGDNPVADFLRFNVPPFVLVRYNHLYFWLVTLLIATFAWRRIELITGTPTINDHVPPATRAWGPRLATIGLACLVVSALVGMATPDAYGLGAPADGISAMGSPHLAWQATILFVTLLTGLTALRNSNRSSPKTETSTWATLMVTSVIAFLAACVAGVLLRKAGVHPQTITVPFSWQLALDLAHGGFILLVTALLFARVRSRTALRTGLAAIMILDVSLAVPRYFSDNDTVGASQPNWPFASFDPGRGGDQFLPRTNGLNKDDFAQPFSSAFSPPPPVTRLRADWGTVYEQWVHFPATWTLSAGGEAAVSRDSLTAVRSTPDCTKSAPNAGVEASGRVTRLLATTVDVPFTADCDRLLVFTDSWAPGWSATIDGTRVPVLRVNDAIRGVMVPAGEHSLVWHYRPRFLAPLLALLATGLGISGILIAAPWWSRRFPLAHRLDRLFGFGPLPTDEIHGPLLAPLPNTPAPAISPASTDAPARDWQRLPAMWRHGLPIALPLTGLAILVLISVTAYDPRIDGPTQGFRLFLFRSVLAGLWAWIVIAGRTGFRSPVGPSLMLLVLLPPLVLQMARHTDRVSNGMPVASITTDFRSLSWQDKWDVTRRGNEATVTGPSGILLRNDGGTATAITLATKPITQDLWAWWRRPLGRIGPGPLDVAWTA